MATVEAALALVKRFGGAERTVGGFAALPFGFGTYRSDERPGATASALSAFLERGLGNHIDTSSPGPHKGDCRER